MTTPPPGWYSDPQNVFRIRWWDGQKWTIHTHQATSSAPPPAPAVPSEPRPRETAGRRSRVTTAVKVVGGVFVAALVLVGCAGAVLESHNDEPTSGSVRVDGQVE